MLPLFALDIIKEDLDSVSGSLEGAAQYLSLVPEAQFRVENW
jgi:hypothetical protein